jgi:asparagine synthase (glutamine-hydrolysing)
MCGIFFVLHPNSGLDKDLIYSLFKKIGPRGPDTEYYNVSTRDIRGFHRLAINDVSNPAANQPFVEKDTQNFLMCNGEIYNCDSLKEKYDIATESDSDCEVLLPLFKKIGVYKAVNELDGVFAIVTKIKDKYYAVRDRIGVRPLFVFKGKNFVAIASDPKGLEFTDREGVITELQPGVILEIDGYNINSFNYITYAKLPNIGYVNTKTMNVVIATTRTLLQSSVLKRMKSDRPIGCLLSGGLDSSIIASLVSAEYRKVGKRLKTFSIGFSDSTDIVYARKVAQYIGSDHHEYIITHDLALASIPEVVKTISTYDITTVRASTMMHLLCKWISKNFEEKVLFSGEGSDEVCSGYLYFHLAPSTFALEQESKRLVQNLYKYDVLRADRCISGNGLELREPFLDKEFVDFYLKLSGEYRKPRNGYEKWILRKAFEHILPADVAWRRKAAFSDAVSSSEKPWYKYIQEWCDENIDDYGSFPSKESYYYYTLFKKNHTVYNPVIEYWLPKWQDDIGSEPSATALSIYDKREH